MVFLVGASGALVDSHGRDKSNDIHDNYTAINDNFKARIKEISSDIHRLQFIKLDLFKQDLYGSSHFMGIN